MSNGPATLSREQQGTPSRVLIIGPSWVGDMVMAQSLFIAIKQQQPDALIDVLAPAWSKPLLERMPEVEKALEMPLGHGRFGLWMRRELGKGLRNQYQQAIILPNSWKSALIPWFANIPLRTGWKGEARFGLLNDLRRLNKEQLPYMVERFVNLAYPQNHTVALKQCPSPKLIANQERIPALLEKFGLTTDKPCLILCPGAEFGPAKQWPAAHYATIGRELQTKGWQVWIMGSPADHTIAQTITTKAGLPESHNLCGKTSLEEAIDLMSVATQVVSNDSGLMHIASALDVPVIALYGATSPGFTPPLSAKATILSISVECGPCFKRECPLSHHRCMEDLLPETVLQAIDKQ